MSGVDEEHDHFHVKVSVFGKSRGRKDMQRTLDSGSQPRRTASGQRAKVHKAHPLPIALGDTLQLILLLDRVRVAASLGGVDQFFCETLGDALDVSERSLSGTNGEKGNCLVDTSKRGDIHGLSSNRTRTSDSGAVLTGSAVDDGIDGDLDGVLVGHDVNLAIPVLDAGLFSTFSSGGPTISKE